MVTAFQRFKNGGDMPCLHSDLQPLIRPDNIVAAYAMNEPAAPCNVDRSGNGLNFTTGDQLASELANFPDLIPGKAAVMQGGTQLYPTCPMVARKYSQDFALYGELSIIFRVWMLAPIDLAAHTLVYGNAADTTAGSVAFDVGCSNGHKLYLYSERNKSGIAFGSNLVLTPNTWITVGVRRYSNGRVRLSTARGKKGATIAHEESAPMNLPQSATVTNFSATFGATSWAGQNSSAGWADVLFLDTPITDAEFASQAAKMLRGVGA